MRKHRRNHRMNRHKLCFYTLENELKAHVWLTIDAFVKRKIILWMEFQSFFSLQSHLTHFYTTIIIRNHPKSQAASLNHGISDALIMNHFEKKTFTVSTIQWSISDIFFKLSHIMHKDSLLSFLLLSRIRLRLCYFLS